MVRSATPLRKLPEQEMLFNAETEASLYHHSQGVTFFSLLVAQEHGKVQRSFRAREMVQVLRLLPKDKDSWISQAEFIAPNRRVVNLASIGLLFIDVDCYKVGLDPDRAENLLLLRCEEDGFPLPSLIVRSGRGLQVKWLLKSPLPRAALPRWNACQRELVNRFLDLGADPAAKDASRVLRLVDTVNTKSGTIVSVSWAQPTGTGDIESYDFDYLSEFVLPLSRDQLAALRAERQQAKEARRSRFKVVDGNPKARGGFSGRELAWHRVEDLRTLYRLRQGHIEGLSMPLMFWSLNFLLMSGATNSSQMWFEAEALCREFNFGEFRRKSELSTLYHKAKEHEAGKTITYNGKVHGPLYRIRNSTLIDLFQITDDEQKKLKTIIGESEYKERDRLRDEKRRREAGAVTREQYLSASEDKRASARLMRATGMTQRTIATELGVSVGSVNGWLKD
jgi:hypothetical protein